MLIVGRMEMYIIQSIVILVNKIKLVKIFLFKIFYKYLVLGAGQVNVIKSGMKLIEDRTR